MRRWKEQCIPLVHCSSNSVLSHLCLPRSPAERRPSVDDLLRLDFVQGELQRQMHLIEADVASSSAVERPLFTAGHVETVLSQMRSVRSPNRSDSEASEFFSNDRILRWGGGVVMRNAG